MKILQISSGFDISFNGGITNYVRNISTTLTDFGHQVFVLYSQDNGKEKEYNFELINTKPILKPFHLSSIVTNKDLSVIESIIEEVNPDIVHVHMMIDLPISVLEVIKRYSKLVISLHDYSYICNRIILLDNLGNNCTNSNENLKCNSCISLEESIDNRLIGGILRTVSKGLRLNKIANSSNHDQRFKKGRRLFENADAVIAVSNRVKELYELNGYKNPNFYVNHIGNYTAENFFREKFFNRKFIERNKKIKFGFIGNLTVHKGANIFVELVNNTDHEFHIYGGIDQKILEKVSQLPQVFYHGRYQHEQLISILHNIDFGLVLPIWEDNAPQVVFEFLNANIPVLGTKMGGIPDFVNASNGKLFEISDEGIKEVLGFINSDQIYDFYNSVINKISGTKKAEKHMEELIDIYNFI